MSTRPACGRSVAGRTGVSTPAASVERRERRRRRATVLGIAVLLVLTALPLASHVAAAALAPVFAGFDHFGALCLVALHYVLSPVHGAFHVAMLAGLVVATVDRVRAWSRMRRVLRALVWRGALDDARFSRAAAEAGLDARRVRVTAGLPSPAFTVGWVRPVVYVAEELAARLSHRELAAVLSHEAAHVRRRDPLRLTALRVISRTLFWLPPVACLADDLADEMELAADDAAARRGPLALASALVVLAQQYGRRQPAVLGRLGAAGILTPVGTVPDLLEHRVRRLVGEDVAVPTHLTRRCVAVGCAALLVVLASTVVVVHPLPPEDRDAAGHCTHGHQWSLGHLFCRGGESPAHAHAHATPAI